MRLLFKRCFPIVLFVLLSLSLKLRAQVFNTPGPVSHPKATGIQHPDTTVIPRYTMTGAVNKTAIRAENYPLKISMPLRSLRLTSSFGWRIHPLTGNPDFHRGIDLSARDEPVFSILDGRVSACGYNPLLGNYIRVSHGEIESTYGHLSLILVRTGQVIKAAQFIGVTGSTGRTTGGHLHFSIKFQGSYIHPLCFLKKITGSLLAVR